MFTDTMHSAPVRPNISSRCAPIRRRIMARHTCYRVSDRAGYMTRATGRTGAGNPLQVRSVAEGALARKSFCIGMPVCTVVIPRPVIAPAGSRVCRPVVVAPFTPVAAGRGDPEIETRRIGINRRRSVTRLTVEDPVREGCGQPLGRRAMIGRIQEGAINRVRNCPRSTTIVAESDRQPGITQLVTSIAVTTSRIAAEINFVVRGVFIHVNPAVPVVTLGIRAFVEQGVTGNSREVAAGGILLGTMTDRADIVRADSRDTAVGHTERCCLICRAVRRITVAEGAIEGEAGHTAMTAEAAHPHPAGPVQIDPMAEGTARLNDSGRNRVVEGVVRPRPIRWVGQVCAMTALAPLTAGAADPEVEARIASRSARLGVTGLAVEHSVRECRGQSLGRRPVIGGIEEGAVERMRSARPAGMAGLPVETHGIAARYVPLATQVGAMANGALSKIR